MRCVQAFVGSALLVIATVFTLSLPSAAAADAICGNGITEANEECDSGGICIGGSAAGTGCTADNDCAGEGVCRQGTKAGTACSTDSQCPGSTCVHCITFGGHGCAANCTLEHDVAIELVPGTLDDAGTGIIPGTSGVVLLSQSTSIALPLAGSQMLTIGAIRNGKITGVIKANTLLLVPFGQAACACVRGVAYKTCGGTLFDADGTASTNCTDGFGGGGADACLSRKPCTAVFGDGNSAAGTVGCDSLDGVDFSLTQDHTGGGVSCTDGTQCPSGTCVPDPNIFPAGSMTCGAFTPVFASSGAGGAGSVVLLNSLAVGTIIGACTGNKPDYGSDGKFCTNDDPPAVRGIAAVAPMVTGTTMAAITHADGTEETLGPAAVSGARLSCSALTGGDAGGAVLAGAFALINETTLMDTIVTTELVAQAAPGSPTPTSTPSPIPPTPTLTPVPCTGDCDHSNTVTVNEILTLVYAALGDALPSTCLAGDANQDELVTIDEILTAVNNALHGCGGT